MLSLVSRETVFAVLSRAGAWADANHWSFSTSPSKSLAHPSPRVSTMAISDATERIMLFDGTMDARVNSSLFFVPSIRTTFCGPRIRDSNIVRGAGHDDVDAVGRDECERQIRRFFSRMGEESHERVYAAGPAAGGRDLAASLASRQAP
jgi:hypothetical protein